MRLWPRSFRLMATGQSRKFHNVSLARTFYLIGSSDGHRCKAGTTHDASLAHAGLRATMADATGSAHIAYVGVVSEASIAMGLHDIADNY